LVTRRGLPVHADPPAAAFFRRFFPQIRTSARQIQRGVT
jgi:hypothetical protein